MNNSINDELKSHCHNAENIKKHFSEDNIIIIIASGYFGVQNSLGWVPFENKFSRMAI